MMDCNLFNILGLSFLPPTQPTTSKSPFDFSQISEHTQNGPNSTVSPEQSQSPELSGSENSPEDSSSEMSTETIAQLILNNPHPPRLSPQKRKGRSLAETVEILKRKKEERPAPQTVSQTALANGANGLSMFFQESENAADRLAKIVSQEQEREIKNRIKALTNQIPVDCNTSCDDDKRFSCQICAKKFANKFLLNKHIFIHTGLRPHQCPDCHKSFNRKDNLLRHRKTHLQAIGTVPALPVSLPKEQLEVNAASPESLLLGLFTTSD